MTPRTPPPPPGSGAASGAASGAGSRAGSRAGRPRLAEADERLRRTVLTLVRRGGPRAVTVEAVARESGIAKTTIYRRFADRDALLGDALRTSIGTPSIPGDGDARTKTRAALQQAWHQMRDVLGAGGLAALVLDEQPVFTQLFRDALAPYDEALSTLLAQDRAAGHLRADLDADAVVTLFIGAYLGELVRNGAVGEDWLERCLDLLWPTMAPPDHAG